MASKGIDHKIAQQSPKERARQVGKVDSVQAGPTSATPKAKVKVQALTASSPGLGLTKLGGMDMGESRATDCSQ